MKRRVPKLVSLLLAALIFVLPSLQLAQERRGAEVIIARKDGKHIRGELIAVKPDSFLLLSPAGGDEAVGLNDVREIWLVRKSKAGTGFLVGALVGGIGGALLIRHQGELASISPGAGAAIFGALAGLVGLVVGMAAGSDETIQLEGMPEQAVVKALARLRTKARMPNMR